MESNINHKQVDTVGKLYLPIDNQRIHEIVGLAFDTIIEYCGSTIKPREEVLTGLGLILANGKISVDFRLPIGVPHARDLHLEVKVRSRKVICRTSNKKLQIQLNKMIGA